MSKLRKAESAQHSVHPTWGRRRVFKQFAWLEVDSVKMALSHPTHQLMKPKRLVFKPIDLDAHVSVCVAFQRDSYICSFGEDGFFNEAGPNGVYYIERLRLRTTKFPDGYVHLWYGDQIVGQMELQILEEPRRGYVSLFYLVEEMRGAGVSGQLQDYAMDFMLRHGVQSAQLSVSPTNARALAFYRKHGWRNLGLRPGRDNVNLMECDVPANVGSRL